MDSGILRIADTSLTDGQSAVWSGAMTSAMFARVIGSLEGSGLSTVEVMSTGVILQCIERGENPWQRLEIGTYQNSTIPFRASINLLTAHGRKGADRVPDEVAGEWITSLVERNVRQILVIDPLPDYDRLSGLFGLAGARDLLFIGVLPFTEDVELTDEALLEQANDLVDAGAGSIMLRDESGVLTPDRVSTLVPGLVESLQGIPLTLHTRCTTALGPLVAIEAIRCGVSELDTALPTLANGGSLPSSITLARSLDLVQVDSQRPEPERLARADAILQDIADRENFPVGNPWVFDLAPYAHQLPGDVAAEAMRRLREGGKWHLLHRYARECARIRQEIGSPPMLYPFAPAIAEQAFIHLETGERYSRILPVVRRTVQQIYGKTPGEIDVDLLARLGALEPGCTSRSDRLQEPCPSGQAEQRVLEYVTALTPEEQPRPSRLEALVYDEIAAEEKLERGLQEYSSRYAYLGFTGPGIDLQYSTPGGES